MKKLIFIIFTFITLYYIFPVRAESEALTPFVEGNELYQKSEYSKALEKYQQALSQETTSAVFNFNLANTYFKLDQFGEAIFYYRKAQTLAPRDADIKYNLNHARKQATDKIEDRSSLLDKTLETLHIFNEKEAFLLTLGSVILAFFFALSLFWAPFPGVKPLFSFFIGVFVFGLFSLGMIRWNQNQFGVITNDESFIYSAPGRNNVVLFSLHKGAEFSWQDSDEDWIQIQLLDGKKGWLNKNEALIHSHPR